VEHVITPLTLTELGTQIQDFVDRDGDAETPEEHELMELINDYSSDEGFWYFVTQMTDPEDMIRSLVVEADVVLNALLIVQQFEGIWQESTWDM
jgi:hypothetical protein